MRVAIITVAGESSRFNEGIPEKEKSLKCIYSECGKEDTLLYRLLKKCENMDRIIIVGGYKYSELDSFCSSTLPEEFSNIELVYNPHYSDWGSGYSLYLGIQTSLMYNPDEILFAEGDLDVDQRSFDAVLAVEGDVITVTNEPIYANKSVVLYKDENKRYKYVYNSSHGLLRIDGSFSCIFNSGQIWKFCDCKSLKKACSEFYESDLEGTNLVIIQRYFDSIESGKVTIVTFERWINCNTRDDYKKIKQIGELNI